MDIRIVYDNERRQLSLKAGWGFSALLGDYLFDTGKSGPSLLLNLNRLGYDIRDLRGVIISHDHWDHRGGLWDLLQAAGGLKVYACPGFSEEFKDKVHTHGGRLAEVKEFTPIDSGLYLTGEIEGKHRNNRIVEQAAIIKTAQGISVCTGCAHPGVVSVAEKSIEPFPGVPANTVFGGFHLRSWKPEDVEKVIAALRKMGFKSVFAGHCSGNYTKKHATGRLYTGLQFAV